MLLLSGAGMWNTEEQTHLLQIGGGPVEGVSLHHLWFHYPPRAKQDGSGNERGGDCIRLIGGPGKAIRFTTITNSQFLECDPATILQGLKTHAAETARFARPRFVR